MVGRRTRSLKDSYYEENTVFLSAEDLHRWIEMLFFETLATGDELKLDMQMMRQVNKHLFWNLIYYFNEFQLPFEFFLPYEDTKTFDQQYEELKKVSAHVKVQIQKDDIDEDLI
jgi:molybdenum cofactor biosynthesis enzyme MoaA